MPVKTKIAQKIKDEIDKYLAQKSYVDSIVTLTKNDKTTDKFTVENRNADSGYMTLLSEGSVLYKDNTIRLYIAKGTLSKWYNSLDDDYQGYVTVGHVSLDSFPVRQGYFNKSDLKIVTDKDGRSDLLVKPHVNLELSSIKDLIIQDEPFAISSEFTWSEMENPDIADYARLVTYNISNGGDAYIPITDNIDILGFSFVGNCGNAKSGGYEPSILKRNEEERLNKKEILEKVLEYLNTVDAKEDKEVPDEVVVEETVNEEEKPNVIDLTTARIEELEREIVELKQQNDKLEKENAELKENEKVIDEQFSKLESLLGSSNVSIEKLETKKEEEVVNRFGRKRFGGIN